MPLSAPLSLEPRIRWLDRSPPEGVWRALALESRLPDLQCRLLCARGAADAAQARAYLEGTSQTHEPLLLSGMPAAVARLKLAFERRDKVTIFGDYDVDGVTSTVLLAKLFGLLQIPYDYYLPNRLKEGYGPNIPALEDIRRRGAAVVVTVDCGVTALAEARAAKAMGLDYIVTDHHVAGPELPDALALVNPKTSPHYPYDMLGGVGVAYKLAQALLDELSHPRKAEFLDHMLELVALGTVCDVAPLDGENRWLVKQGLERLRQGRWLGLRCLGEAAGLRPGAIDSGSLGFVLGPRLNAGGRVGDPALGVKLLLSKEAGEARALASSLEAENKRRQAIEKEVLLAASGCAALALSAGAKALVLWGADWHPGVLGLAASRLLEKHGLPVMVGALSGPWARFSGRSRRPFNLVQALQACASHLSKFGGHEFAAGATVAAADLDAFKAAFLARAEDLRPEDRAAILSIDAWVGFPELTPLAMEYLEAMEPFGIKNPRPILAATGLRLLPACRMVGADGSHLKLALKQGEKTMEGIAFKQGARLAELGGPGAVVDAAFHLAWNDFNGKRSLQLEVRDLRPTVGP